MMIRIGTVGTGWIVDAFLEGAAQGAPDLRLSAVYSRSLEKGEEFAKRHGVSRVFTDLEEMAASPELDAVYIASPNALHYPQAKVFLEHGKHVLCEKTCVVTCSQLEELYQIADRTGAVFLEAIKVVHLPELELVRSALEKLGDIHLAKFDFSRYSSKYPQYLAGQTPNIFNPKLAAGALMDMGVYSVYPAIALFGRPQKIQADAVFLRTGADGAGSAIFTYEDKLVSINYSKLSESWQNNTIQGDKGIMIISTIEHLDKVDIRYHDGRVENVVTRDLSVKPMGWEALDFARCIQEPAFRRERYPEFRRLSLENLAAIEAIRHSAGITFPEA